MMYISGPTVNRAAVTPDFCPLPSQSPAGLHMCDSPWYLSYLSGLSFSLKLFIGLESRNAGTTQQTSNQSHNYYLKRSIKIILREA